MALTATLLSLPGCTGPTGDPEPRPAGPNILVVVTDDQRADTLHLMPQTRRWFGEEGTMFTSAYATTPLCCPSRATILTGKYAHNHRVRDNGQAERLDPRLTIERHLQEAGYRTGIAGKYLNRWDLKRSPAYFDEWAIFNKRYWGAGANVDGDRRKVRGYSTSFVERRAISFLEMAEDDDARPWFLYVAPYAPHPPSLPAPEDKAEHIPLWRPTPAVREKDRSDKPPFVRQFHVTPGRGAELRRKQVRSLLAVDRLVGSIAGSLRRLGEERSTLSIFMSDNGYLWGEHGLKDKNLAYPASSRVPLLIRWPGHAAAGRRDARLAATVDVAPTILDAAGVGTESSGALDGRSLLGPGDRDRLLLEYWRSSGGRRALIPRWAGLVTRRYRYVEYYGGRREIAFREFYDLRRDPWELRNLLGDENRANDPSTGRLHALLAADRGCVGVVGPTACP